MLFCYGALLDFLGLKDTFGENDLETAILRQIERFLLELGTDFSFVARQKRMSVGPTDYYLDLLFYHRRMRALVAPRLKLGKDFSRRHRTDGVFTSDGSSKTNSVRVKIRRSV